MIPPSKDGYHIAEICRVNCLQEIKKITVTRSGTLENQPPLGVHINIMEADIIQKLISQCLYEVLLLNLELNLIM